MPPPPQLLVLGGAATAFALALLVLRRQHQRAASSSASPGKKAGKKAKKKHHKKGGDEDRFAPPLEPGFASECYAARKAASSQSHGRWIAWPTPTLSARIRTRAAIPGSATSALSCARVVM